MGLSRHFQEWCVGVAFPGSALPVMVFAAPVSSLSVPWRGPRRRGWPKWCRLRLPDCGRRLSSSGVEVCSFGPGWHRRPAWEVGYGFVPEVVRWLAVEVECYADALLLRWQPTAIRP